MEPSSGKAPRGRVLHPVRSNNQGMTKPAISTEDLAQLEGILRNAEGWALNIQRQGAAPVDQAELAEAVLGALRIVQGWRVRLTA